MRVPALYFVKKFERDITIKNPYSKRRIKLNLYKHKGYWFFSGSREQATINSFKKLISKGDLVIEVGAHIGFITHLFSELVGKTGKVKIFEPGSNNLPYTRNNVAELLNVELIEKGCSDKNEEVTFYQDSLSGQNNSLLRDYANVDAVAKSHGEDAVRVSDTIQVITLDDYLGTFDVTPSHIKIDVEGAELLVLKGMLNNLGKVPSMMIEVTENANDVFELLHQHGYKTFSEDMTTEISRGRGNTFCLLEIVAP